MSSAGQQLVAGRIPGERIATAIATADSATFTTTETEIMSVTAPLVQGRTYRITFDGKIACNTTAANTFLVRLRLTNTGGTHLQVKQFSAPLNSTTGMGVHIEVQYTAPSTANVEFIASAVENGGAATFNMDAAADAPNYLYVDYIEG